LKNTKASIQTEPDDSIVLNLTPSEIFESCGVGFQSGFSSFESYVVDYEDGMPWCHAVENRKTSNSCCIGVIENDRNGVVDIEYVVELQVALHFVVFIWNASNSPADMEYVKKCAHQTFIKVCTLIGVKVGYHLVTDPSPY